MRKCKGLKKVFSPENGKYLKKEFEGVFHGWGVDGEELESSVLSFSCAIVEDESGMVHLLHADGLQFLGD
ncbi:hypothetical protein CYV26_01920 [Carnobacterium maltaromaticum]|uniref:hypothetical protein n=1 Tax=Carnobacterium maltaromaticum TaxID=2751 RepID=UPI000C792BF3|nr:hypothetical protein [Carnobacterium maltaromaticum]PLS36821.1 hypothetical protein CYV33_04595 [Carnobacterium maltaromaticum]PLS37636.1 hypothetical protein CYV30_04590 [Carnobacterium maltaromaticum]PLS39578.1 hypothetical protein CYV31_02575 [Carnobacterium maltaromaticum]PLS44333.1 hypothetical protein CYV28_04590 [Carnobacterium maltaromaticum]PLS46367.1 hypothetical protein CYV27_04585 [Carnobacterium maltaromaticum]